MARPLHHWEARDRDAYYRPLKPVLNHRERGHHCVQLTILSSGQRVLSSQSLCSLPCSAEEPVALRPVRRVGSHPLAESDLLKRFAPGTAALPKSWRMAFAAVNHLREAAGFSDLHVYSSTWSEKGQAHGRYFCATGHSGHFEQRGLKSTCGQELFTDGGNAAAGHSGLAYNGRNPLDTLFALLEGPFHRRQFMHCVATDMGVSFHSENGRVCGLFPCAPQERAAWHWPRRFHLWPPNGYQFSPSTFHSELPDPRPVELVARGLPTGLIASIAFTRDEDVVAFISLGAVQFVDLTVGSPVKYWTRDPTCPPMVSDEVWYDLYGRAKPTGPNHLEQLCEVWVGAVEPLEPGHDYSISVTMKFHFNGGSEEVTVAWEFGTLPIVEYSVLSALHDFEHCMGICQRGDRVVLGEGVFILPERWWDGGLCELFGAGPSLTCVMYGSGEAVGNGTVRSDLKFRGLSLINHVHDSFFWVMPGITVVLEDVHIRARGSARRFNVAAGGTLRFSGCDLCGLSVEDPYVVYCEEEDGGLTCEQCHEQHPGALWTYSGNNIREIVARPLIPHQGMMHRILHMFARKILTPRSRL